LPIFPADSDLFGRFLTPAETLDAPAFAMNWRCRHRLPAAEALRPWLAQATLHPYQAVFFDFFRRHADFVVNEYEGVVIFDTIEVVIVLK
jgi:hypothetical protein